jgi:hypothetical protein
MRGIIGSREVCFFFNLQRLSSEQICGLKKLQEVVVFV